LQIEGGIFDGDTPNDFKKAMMEILIVGSGAMGRRHVKAILDAHPDAFVTVMDRQPEALEKVKVDFVNYLDRLRFLSEPNQVASARYDGAIVATSARNRTDVVKGLLDSGIRNLLIEKPVEQSIEKFRHLMHVVESHEARAHVNFTRRTFQRYNDFHEMLHSYPQFAGPKKVVITGGAIGIGCIGSHLMDLVFWLLGASSYVINYADISDVMVGSGRGPEYGDFGGQALASLFDHAGNNVGDVYLNLNAESTAPHVISIAGQHGRIDVDEIKGTYNMSMRKVDSVLPYYRYYGDYEGINTYTLDFPGLHVGTLEWIAGLDGSSSRLPLIRESVLVHEFIFEWLEKSSRYSGYFPIT
jgi:predicted dehydrogenase